jgi:hypothetical protein
VTVHVEVPPEVRVVGVQATLVRSTGACNESVTEAELPLSIAVTVADCGVVRFAETARNVPVDTPEEIITEAGTESAAELLLVRLTVAPPDGAFWFSMIWQFDDPPDIKVFGEHVIVVTRGPEFWEILALPGAGRFARASSITSTQSLPSGAVKLCDPLFGNVPVSIAVPVCGLYHQAIAVEDADVISAMLIVFAVALPSETYAIMVCPSELRAATDNVEPEPNPAVRIE